MFPRVLWSVLVGVALWSPAVWADDKEWLIVPGKSVGKISLGMPQSEVFRLLGAPQMQNDFDTTKDRQPTYLSDKREGKKPDGEGVTQNDWTTPRPVPRRPSSGSDQDKFLCDFITVYTREEKVMQIEVRVPRFRTADGLSTTSKEGEWHRRFSGIEEFQCKYHHPSSGGIPASKHFFAFADDVKEGIAWSCDGWGNAFPEVTLEPDDPVYSVVIHAPGERVLPDPDGGSRFIWKENPDSHVH